MRRKRTRESMAFIGANTKLKAVRLMDVCLIPRRLLEQIKPKEWPPEAFYSLGAAITQAGLLYGWVDGESAIRGFLWANINPLDMRLHVHVLSVDREYQGKGIMADAVELCKLVAKASRLRGIVAWTRGPKAFSRMGFNATGEVKCVMET